MLKPTDVTLIDGAVHNPSEPRHFMQLVPATSTNRAAIGEHRLAESNAAIIVKEVARSIYDPVVYFPRADVDMTKLVATDKSTHCPLKGDTEYFDAVLGETTIADAAWSYIDMVGGAEALQGLIAFDRSKVVVS